MTRPKEYNGRTFMIWKYERVTNNPNWVMEGLAYKAVDSLEQPFKIKVIKDQVLVLYDSKYTKEKLKPSIKKNLLKIYEDLNLEY